MLCQKIFTAIHEIASKIRLMRFSCFITLFLGVVCSSFAQLGTNDNFQLWVDPSIGYQLSSATRLSADLYYRTRLNDTQWQQTVLRPGISHVLSKRVIVLGGVGWFSVRDHELPVRNEIRYWAGMQYTHPLVAKIDLQHYLRIEERTFYQEGIDNFDILRFRYRLGLSYALKKLDEKGKSRQLMLQYEPMLAINKWGLAEQFFSTERIYLGLGNTLSKKTRLDIFYMLQWGKVSKVNRFEFTDYILQLRFQYTLNAQ